MSLKKLIFVTGYGRSGSTLLDRSLGALPGCFSTGELVHIWSRLDGSQDCLCGCGVPFSQCLQWQKILAGFHTDDRIPHALQMVKLAKELYRLRYYPPYFAQWIFHRKASRLLPYLQTMQEVYELIYERTGSHTIIDSSKIPSLLMVLPLLQNIDVTVVHLVRDPRGVAFSQTKKQLRPEVHWAKVESHSLPVWYTALAWSHWNRWISSYRWHLPRYQLLRYEDFIQDPIHSLQTLCDQANMKVTTSLLEQSLESDIVDHTIGGNSMRLQAHSRKLKLDETWRKNLSHRNCQVVEFICHQQMKQFGYLAGKSNLNTEVENKTDSFRKTA